MADDEQDLAGKLSPAAKTAALSGPHAPELSTPGHTPHQAFWLWVMCLTGVDYFSTLGYQPSIAYAAAGILAPLATIVLVTLTLAGALPVYSYVASRSPHGQGSIAMLERLMRGWLAKATVLVLLGFAATDFVITKTLSAADAAVHLVENPYWKEWTAGWPESLGWFVESQLLYVTMFILVFLGAMFLRGFREVIGAAVVIVSVYLVLNFIVVISGLVYLLAHGDLLSNWVAELQAGDWHAVEHLPLVETMPLADRDFWAMVVVCLLIFPKLALGLSGFETGVAVMPLIRGAPDDEPHRPAARIRNTRKLLATAAIIMCVFLLGSSLVITTLVPPEAHKGPAHERALAYIAHGESPYLINPMFGEFFGTLYDISTIVILGLCRRECDGGALESRATVSAAVRHGPGVGAAIHAARDSVYRDQLVRDLDLRRQRDKAGGRVCHRCARADDQRLRGHSDRQVSQ